MTPRGADASPSCQHLTWSEAPAGVARNPLARSPPVRKTGARVTVYTEIVDYLHLGNGTSRDVPPAFPAGHSPADRISPRHPAGRYRPHWHRLPRDRRWTAGRPLTPAAPPGPLDAAPAAPLPDRRGIPRRDDPPRGPAGLTWTGTLPGARWRPALVDRRRSLIAGARGPPFCGPGWVSGPRTGPIRPGPPAGSAAAP